MSAYSSSTAEEFLSNLNSLHTTDLGALRIRRNLSLPDTEDIVGWCAAQIEALGSIIERRGKNWYITTADSVITVNAHSNTIITAHFR